MRNSTVLFDLDGTLTKSEEGIINSARAAASRMGFDREDLDWKKFIGPPLHASFMEYCGMTDREAEQAVLLYRERFSVLGWQENRVYPGIPTLLRTLRNNGQKAAIVTSKPQIFAERIAKRFGLMPFLSGIIGPDEGEKSPSKEALIKKAMKRLPGPFVMVGDRRYDVEGAKACSIASVGVLYGYGDRQELEAAGADSIARDVAELRDIVTDRAAPARGIFITMEGVDGCGKSTQRAALLEEMERLGYEITLTREPGGDEVAEKIRSLILDPANAALFDETEAYLYAASRAQNVRALILPALEAGRMVLCDRYVDSSIAYQGGGRGLGWEKVAALNAWATEGCMPDLTVYLSMDPQAALARRLEASTPDRLEREQLSFFERTHAAYEAYYEQAGERVLRVQADQPIAEVTAEMLRGVLARLEKL